LHTSKLAQAAYQLVRSAGSSRSLSLSRLVVVAALFICLLCLARSCERVDGQIMHKGLLKATNATRQTKHANVQELIVATFCFDV